MAVPSPDQTQTDFIWHQGDLLEMTIADLSDDGAGVARVDQRVVFVPDTVPGDRVQARLVQVKSRYAWGKLHRLLEPSPDRIRPSCIVADRCGGCQWQHINPTYQRQAKENLIRQALTRIGGFSDPPISPILIVEPTLAYRNKATYPIAWATTGERPRVVAGYYRKGSHRLVNLNQCPVQDPRLNPFLAEIKQDIQRQGWSVYDEQHHQGEIRHLALRIGRRTGEILLTLVTQTAQIPNLETQAQQWLDRYATIPGIAPNLANFPEMPAGKLVGVCVNRNPDRTNVIFGPETWCVAGQPQIREIFADLTFEIRAETFFQVNTEAAEAVVQTIQQELDLQGHETLVDAYCGIGTLTLPLARFLSTAIGLEVQASAVEQARANAALNGITNASFRVGPVAEQLPQLDERPDIVLLDPPRRGCDRTVIDTLRQIQPPRIIYVSCKPATLARDLKALCADGLYALSRIQPADFFPQTAHVECIAFLHHQL